jgi:hypothetical protein
MEMQKFQNSGTTNYFDLDKKEQLDLLLQDMFCSFWNGERGEANVYVPGTSAANYYRVRLWVGYSPYGFCGSATASGVTEATLQETFEALAFATDYKREGAVGLYLVPRSSCMPFQRLIRKLVPVMLRMTR